MQMHTDQMLDIFYGGTAALVQNFTISPLPLAMLSKVKNYVERPLPTKVVHWRKMPIRMGVLFPQLIMDNGQVLSPQQFNVHTIKNHSLGDYPDKICCYGTTDSYSTEHVSAFFCNPSWLCWSKHHHSEVWLDVLTQSYAYNLWCATHSGCCELR